MKKILFIAIAALLLTSCNEEQAKNNDTHTAAKVEETKHIAPASGTAKIGVVDLNKILLDSPQLNAAKTDLKKKFDPREKELNDKQKSFQKSIEDFSKNSPTMKPADKEATQKSIMDEQKKLQELQSKFQSDLSAEQNKLMGDILKKIETIVNKIAANKNFDLVITKVSTAFNKKELEITDEVVKEMKE